MSDALATALMERGAIDRAAAPMPIQGTERPWFISMLLGVAGWLAGLVVLVFVAALFEPSGAGRVRRIRHRAAARRIRPVCSGSPQRVLRSARARPVHRRPDCRDGGDCRRLEIRRYDRRRAWRSCNACSSS